MTSSSHESTVRVTELKRVLSTNARHSSPLRGRPEYARSNTSSESLVSADFSETDTGVGTTDFAPDAHDEQSRPRSSRDSEAFRRDSAQRPRSAGSLTSHPVIIQPETQDRPKTSRKSDDIPPVPPLPFSLNLPGRFPSDIALSTASAEQDHEQEPQRTSTPPAQPAQLERPRTADSSRAGRPLRRKKSKPGSRRVEKSSLSSWGGEDGGKVDLGALLGRISIEDEEGIPSGKGASRPPY